MIYKHLYLLLILLSLLFPGSSYGGCKSDCRDNYDSAREDCITVYDDPDDADDLRSCIDDAKSEYDDCLEECRS
jgi:hypothetical protein